ncbi:MAG: AmmeMemoRadiSam system protein B [Candidatus Pacebacteria bacterium]|nr:AmmeMemoRadiSam system protein B [Candidatus Paceibacterota bacterium]PIR63796.1 MAG: AmmeMemoRadiSam system protein B [Candidatus Pacebacteria bacterium CG10_big_fil_rev_8_21_14_0_10_40_26]
MSKYLWFLLVVFLVGISIAVFLTSVQQKQTANENEVEHQDLQPIKSWDEALFSVGLKKYQPTADSPKITGSVIPHHLVANEMIIDVLSRIQAQNPESIFLLTPNHYEQGSTAVITSNKNWETPFGTTYIDKDIINKLTESDLVSIENDALSNEHAVAGLVHYFKYFLPDTKIIPLAVSNTLTLQSISEISALLESVSTPETVIVTSVDFSHYLSSEESDKRDTLTIEAIKNDDYELLRSFSNEYLDSPSALITHLLLMKKYEHSLTEIKNSNSGTMLSEPNSEGTSYFELIWE